MEKRLKTLAKNLHDAANEAERCCEYQTKMDDLQKANEKLRFEKNMLQRQLQNVKDKEIQYLDAVAKEKDISAKLQLRLEESESKLSALRENVVTLGNKPQQVDVSDKLRPTKVAEFYQDLYDNEWTDAYEMLESCNDNEEKTIEKLLNVLKHVMDFCKTRSKDQNIKLKQMLLLTEDEVDRKLSNIILGHLQFCKKDISCETVEKLFGMYISSIQTSRRNPDMETILKIKPFVKECIKTCWLCLIQHPPLHIDFETNAHDRPFDPDKYRAYTKTGTHVEYIVWPTLFHHEDGPVLSKGIAQGTKVSPTRNKYKPNILDKSDLRGYSTAGSNKWNMQHTPSSAGRKITSPLLYESKTKSEGHHKKNDLGLNTKRYSKPTSASKHPVQSDMNDRNSYGSKSNPAFSRGRQRDRDLADILDLRWRRESRAKSTERKSFEYKNNPDFRGLARSKSSTDLS